MIFHECPHLFPPFVNSTDSSRDLPLALLALRALRAWAAAVVLRRHEAWLGVDCLMVGGQSLSNINPFRWYLYIYICVCVLCTVYGIYISNINYRWVYKYDWHSVLNNITIEKYKHDSTIFINNWCRWSLVL